MVKGLPACLERKDRGVRTFSADLELPDTRRGVSNRFYLARFRRNKYVLVCLVILPRLVNQLPVFATNCPLRFPIDFAHHFGVVPRRFEARNALVFDHPEPS